MRPIRLVAAISASLALSACGSDSNAPMEGDDQPVTVNFPADAATLQEAIDLAGAGGEVIVADGQYSVGATVTIPTAQVGLTLRGADGARPKLTFTVDPAASDAIIVLAPNVTVRNLELDGTFRIGIAVLAGGSSGGTQGGEISDCVIRGAGEYAIECGSPASDITVQRNVLVDPGAYGVVCLNGSAPMIELNTIVGAGDCAIYSDLSFPTCRRNILVESANYGVACFNNSQVSLACNVLFANGAADYSPGCVAGADDQHADPLFCDPVAFTLLAGSPCAPANAGACQGIGAVETVCPAP